MNRFRKKPAMGRMPHLVTVEDDTCSCTSGEDDVLVCVGFADTPEKPNSDPEVSDSNFQTDSHITPTFGSKGFRPTDSDQRDEAQGNSARTEDAEMPGSVPPLPSSPVGGKRSPYALNIRDLNPGMHAFLSLVKKYFTQKINLERQRAALCATTYDKTQERILGTCKSHDDFFFSHL